MNRSTTHEFGALVDSANYVHHVGARRISFPVFKTGRANVHVVLSLGVKLLEICWLLRNQFLHFGKELLLSFGILAARHVVVGIG